MNPYTKIMHLKAKKPKLSTDLFPSYVPMCTCLILYIFRDIDKSKKYVFLPNHCPSVGKHVYYYFSNMFRLIIIRVIFREIIDTG